MCENNRWWGDIRMRPHVSLEMVAQMIAEEIGSLNQERMFPLSEVINIDQVGPGDDPKGYETSVSMSCLTLEAMDEINLIEKALHAIALLAVNDPEALVYCLFSGDVVEGVVYRFRDGLVERTDAAFLPVEPQQWKSFDC